MTDEPSLLKLAVDGDEAAFGELTGAYRGELRAHCYRILGSVHDADDALQEALLRVWRNLAAFEGRGSLRSWLYSIATNTALDLARHRSRRELPVDFGPAADQGTELTAPLTDLPWLEPFPDRWLAAEPEASYEQRESLELAFIVALQHLPPLQRAVLLLRETLGFSTTEISTQLDTSAAAVNSALQRARATVRALVPAQTQQATLRSLGDQRTRALAGRYADAMERHDVGTLISMLTEDAAWSMPPHPQWYRGHEAIEWFLLRYPFTDRWRHRPAQANGQLAVGCYLHDPARDRYVPHCVDVLTVRGDKISDVTAFLAAGTFEPKDSGWITGTELFARFGLPPEPP
ncbi:MAG TPA: sigma-70 family RNA polymerase sigma factor, partial [Streptosporangiaceae bacterium]